MLVQYVTSTIQMLQTILGMLSPYTGTSQLYPKPAIVIDGQKFDFIVVGAGSAGCVLANRLTEVQGWNVLLIEAGDYPPITADAPGFFSLVNKSPADWNYTGENDGFSAKAHKNHQIYVPRGKVVGGSSNLNYMAYVRGNKADFDDWVAQGNEGWDWNNVTYYYKKSERFMDQNVLKGSSVYLHGSDGYLGITRPYMNETEPYFKAFQENGHEINSDYNGKQQLGYAPFQYTIAKGVRQSTAISFIRPIKNRPNLHILTQVMARKIILDNKKAIGVRVKLDNGEIISIIASKEVILSAGAINSPQLLMLSGIGPKNHLEEMNIPVVLDSPNVGRNLHDHLVTKLVLYDEKHTLHDDACLLPNDVGFVPQKFKTLSNSIVNSFSLAPSLLGHVALNKSQSFPDYQANVFLTPVGALQPTIICSHVFKLEDEICEALAKANFQRKTIVVHLAHLHPKSKGNIKLRSCNPEEKPIINLGYFIDPSDTDNYALYIEDFLKILDTSYFKSIKSKVVDLNVKQCKDLVFGSHAYWKCFVLNTANTQFHLSGTCAMGPREVGVLDAELFVRGIHKLRVVDGSIMPSITSGNTYAPIIMIAEKAADMIKMYYGK